MKWNKILNILGNLRNFRHNFRSIKSVVSPKPLFSLHRVNCIVYCYPVLEDASFIYVDLKRPLISSNAIFISPVLSTFYSDEN